MMNEVVLITGSSSGIGEGIALAFAKAGYDVVINYATSKSAAEAVAHECEKFNVKTCVVQCDVKNQTSVKAMIDVVLDRFQKIDVLINNSGITRDSLLMRMREEDFDDVINTNLKGSFNVTQAVIKPMLKQRKGRIINIASVIGQIGNTGQSNYAASKGGLIAFTKSIAKELASRSITVNAIAPGFINTRMTEVLSDEVKNRILDQIPLKRFGEAEDIAQTALFLASPAASYISGQVINVDGGMVM